MKKILTSEQLNGSLIIMICMWWMWWSSMHFFIITCDHLHESQIFRYSIRSVKKNNVKEQ